MQETIDIALRQPVSEERKAILQVLIDYLLEKKQKGEPLNLNFICTHNSRRSQFSQIWAQTAADFYGVRASCFSGGVEITAFNERAVESVRRSGFRVEVKGEGNPAYSVYYSRDSKPIITFSKLYHDAVNAAEKFAAVMTCSHAGENCPYIPGADARIAVRYEDPRAFDDTPEEAKAYDERSLQIAAELFYVFSRLG